jgi:hypothetical protein
MPPKQKKNIKIAFMTVCILLSNWLEEFGRTFLAVTHTPDHPQKAFPCRGIRSIQTAPAPYKHYLLILLS